MRRINIVDELTRQINFIFSMLEGTHATRMHEMLRTAYPNSTVTNMDIESIPAYWDVLRLHILRNLECKDDHDSGRMFLELLRRRLIFVEDVEFMMTSHSVFFHGFPPFHKVEHYHLFLDIQDFLCACVLGMGISFRNMHDDKFKFNIDGKEFLPQWGNEKKSYTFHPCAGFRPTNYDVHKMHRDFAIGRRLGMYIVLPVRISDLKSCHVIVLQKK